MNGKIETKRSLRLQCPECLRSMEMSTKTYRCPLGHVELNVTTEGYPVLRELKTMLRPLLCGGEFIEGAFWEKAIDHCENVIYVEGEDEKEDHLKPLHQYLVDRGRKLSVVQFRELKRLRMHRRTPIIFSHRMGRLNRFIILLKYLMHPIYIYMPGIVIRCNLVRIVRQKLKSILNKFFIVPIVSKGVEVRYHQYLHDEETAREFASHYLPKELRNGSGRQAFDIGCGRGRHMAMLNQLGYAMTGMDIQPHPYWRRIPEASFVLGTADCLSYIPDEAFDLVVCMQVLMYLFNDHAALCNIRRMLKEGGYLLLQATSAENLHTFLTKQPLAEDPCLLRYYKQTELCNQLVQNGFKITQIWNEKFYTPFLILPGNILYEFILSQSLRRFWDKLVSPQHLGLINILARAV